MGNHSLTFLVENNNAPHNRINRNLCLSGSVWVQMECYVWWLTYLKWIFSSLGMAISPIRQYVYTDYQYLGRRGTDGPRMGVCVRSLNWNRTCMETAERRSRPNWAEIDAQLFSLSTRLWVVALSAWALKRQLNFYFNERSPQKQQKIKRRDKLEVADAKIWNTSRICVSSLRKKKKRKKKETAKEVVYKIPTSH